MPDELIVYISAAADLNPERSLLGRLIAEIPVTLGWRIFQTPLHGEPVDAGAVQAANVHLLLLGGDIRAPVGFEWHLARRSHRMPYLFLKQDVPRTPAANDFIRAIGEQVTWRPFQGNPDLRHKVELLLGEHLLSHAKLYSIAGQEAERLKSWFKGLESRPEQAIDDVRGSTGEGGVIISPERFVPKEGVLLNPPPDNPQG
jgi:hypothetical protein